MFSKSPRIASPSGPVVRASAAMAFATASRAGAAATASWFDEPAPDQPEPGDRIAGALDLAGIAVADRDAEVAHVPRRLLERRGVDPQEGERGPVAKEVRGDRRALGFRNVSSRAPAGWRRCAESSGRRCSSAAVRFSRASAFTADPLPCAASERRVVSFLVACSISPIETPASSPAQVSTCTLSTVVRSDCAILAWLSTSSRLERIIAPAPARKRPGRGGNRQLRRPGKAGEPRVRRLHLAREPAEAARSRPRRRPRARRGPAGRRRPPAGR